MVELTTIYKPMTKTHRHTTVPTIVVIVVLKDAIVSSLNALSIAVCNDKTDTITAARRTTSTALPTIQLLFLYLIALTMAIAAVAKV